LKNKLKKHLGSPALVDSDRQKKTETISGVGVIEGCLLTLASSPGVYRMLGAKGDVLYVGKAKNLKKRVASYTRLNRQSNRIRRMVSETRSMEFVTTHTEAEALLLEANFIKQFRPRYNILLRDDKSFPHILLTADHEFPQTLKHRGARKKPGDYFGPFASVWAVNETLTVLQRAFLLRTCTDQVFANRTRACLLYQIKRCSAPCVNKITAEDYGQLVAQARSFLTGGSRQLQDEFVKRMQSASAAQEYEIAAQFRDRIRAMTKIQAHQDIHSKGVSHGDVIAGYQNGGKTCIEVFFYRSGANYGNRAYYPSHAQDDTVEAVIEAFVTQFYSRNAPPKQVILSHRVSNEDLIAEALSVRAGHNVDVLVPLRGAKKKLLDHALNNAKGALVRRLSESATQRQLLEQLADLLSLDGPPNRIEVYDNSHISGTKAVGAMIVAGPEGFMKKEYRKFNIKGAKSSQEPQPSTENGYEDGDDYAMMNEVLTRRFSRVMKEDPDRMGEQWPDLVIVDGGKGQLGVALNVFQTLGIDGVALAAIAKGPDRNAGREKIYLPDAPVIELKKRDPVLYFLQRLRDESHRFVIGTHRQKRGREIKRSVLDEIPGIGARRKKALLLHFGAARAVSSAGRADLEAVEGVSKALAEKIYDWFHGS